MTSDRRHTLFAPPNTFSFSINDRIRRYSTSDKPDLETIYEVNKRDYQKRTCIFFLIIKCLNNYFDFND